jgi:hypothetical protein
MDTLVERVLPLRYGTQYRRLNPRFHALEPRRARLSERRKHYIKMALCHEISPSIDMVVGKRRSHAAVSTRVFGHM